MPALTSRAAMIEPVRMIPPSSIRASTISPSSTSAARVSPKPCSISHSGNRVPRRLQQHPGLGEWQANDVRIAAGDVADIDLAITLEGVTAGLAAPLAVAGVIVDLFIAEPLHRDHRLD